MYPHHELWTPNNWKETIKKALMITNFKIEISELINSSFTSLYEMEYSILKEQLVNNVYSAECVYFVHIIEEYEQWLDKKYDIALLVEK